MIEIVCRRVSFKKQPARAVILRAWGPFNTTYGNGQLHLLQILPQYVPYALRQRMTEGTTYMVCTQ